MDGIGPEMLYDGEGYIDMSTAWRHNEPNQNLSVLISQVLPATASWSDEVKIWGVQSKNDIQVCYDSMAVESVVARIDTRDDTLHMCSKIVELALALDCCLFLPAACSIIIPNVRDLSIAVQNSSAAQFSAAPREFLQQLNPASSIQQSKADG
jgi:hypothetical protein